METLIVNNMKAEEDIVRILEDKLFDIQNLCRICLREDNMETKYCIYESLQDSEAAYTKIMLITKLYLLPHEDGLPGYMCEECKNQLNVANSFRVKCEYSDTLLRKALLKNNVSNDILMLDDLKKEGYEADEDFKKEGINEEYLNMESDGVAAVKKKNKKSKKKPTLKTSNLINDCEVDFVENIKEEINDDFDDALQYSDDNALSCEYVETNDCEINEIKKVACKVCNKLLKSKQSLLKHVQKYHGNKKSSTVPYKIEGYGNDRKFLCTFCEYTSKRKQGIVGHIRTHTGEKPFKCDECTMHFPTSSALCNHKKIHSDQMDHTCPQCGKQFRLKSKYEIHKSVHTTEKKFQCHMCNKLLKSKITLQMHLYRHDNIKNYSCEACGATFVTCSELISHSKSHGGEKKFKCTICKFMTQTKAALDGHLLRHTGERKFECTYCDTKCFTSGTLRNHMIKHTKEKKYPCLFCEQKFAHSSSLNRHMLKSHEKKCKWVDLVDRRIVK